MYSQRYYKLLNFSCHAATTLGVSCLKFHLTKQKFFLCKKSRVKVKRSFSVFLIVSIIWAGQGLDIWKHKGWKANAYFHITYAYSLFSVLHTLSLGYMILFADNIVRLLNLTLGYFERLHRKYISLYSLTLYFIQHTSHTAPAASLAFSN